MIFGIFSTIFHYFSLILILYKFLFRIRFRKIKILREHRFGWYALRLNHYKLLWRQSTSHWKWNLGGNHFYSHMTLWRKISHSYNQRSQPNAKLEMLNAIRTVINNKIRTVELNSQPYLTVTVKDLQKKKFINIV